MMREAESRLGLGEVFRRFAVAECRGVSPLYERLALGIAEDAALLALAAEAGLGQPPPNLLLGAVHALLLAGAAHPLAAYYPSLGGEDTGDPLPAFRNFCRAHAVPLVALLHHRRVQTNEVRRSALLLPALALAAATMDHRPLALVEIGASAGLNLLPDRYGYDYGGHRAGDPASPVLLRCAPRGPLPLPVPGGVPPVRISFRAGIDLAPVDPEDREATAWLRALVWPEHGERAALLEAALTVARQERPPVLAGDALVRLPEVLANAPPECGVCIIHTHTVNQFSREARERLAELLDGAAAGRPLVRIGIEASSLWPARDSRPPGAYLARTRWLSGVPHTDILARCDPHGAWLEWEQGTRDA